jgi:hypothetical protein
MTEVEAIQKLTDVVERQSVIEGAGWIAWFFMLVVIASLLVAIWLELRSRRSMSSEEAMHIIENAIQDLSRRGRG